MGFTAFNLCSRRHVRYCEDLWRLPGSPPPAVESSAGFPEPGCWMRAICSPLSPLTSFREREWATLSTSTPCLAQMELWNVYLGAFHVHATSFGGLADPPRPGFPLDLSVTRSRLVPLPLKRISNAAQPVCTVELSWDLSPLPSDPVAFRSPMLLSTTEDDVVHGLITKAHGPVVVLQSIESEPSEPSVLRFSSSCLSPSQQHRAHSTVGSIGEDCLVSPIPRLSLSSAEIISSCLP